MGIHALIKARNARAQIMTKCVCDGVLFKS